MEIHSQGVYKSGVILPEQPLELPDNTKVRFVLVPEGEPQSAGSADGRAKPHITREELDELTRKYGVAVRTLPTPDDSDVELADAEHHPSGVLTERPQAPRISSAELHERIRKYAFSAPSLPADFSREDIYNDHD